MNTNSDLLKEIEAFAQKRGIAETTFGKLAVNDGKFVRRLREGGRMFRETEDRVRHFMAQPLPERRPSNEGAGV